MIKVDRTQKPVILEQNATIWTADYLAAKTENQLNPSPENKNLVEKAEKKYNNTDIKDALKAMFNKKCAFCESHITHIDYGDIEHFRPKSKFPELCFKWNNLLFSCSICNGKSNKGDKFPLENEGGFLVNPVEENPNDFFRFEFDEITNSFLVIPLNQRADTTLKIIKLNRDDLVEYRNLRLSKIQTIISKIEDDGDKLTEFRKLFTAKDDYYAFIKRIIYKSTS